MRFLRNTCARTVYTAGTPEKNRRELYWSLEYTDLLGGLRFAFLLTDAVDLWLEVPGSNHDRVTTVLLLWNLFLYINDQCRVSAFI